MRVAMSTQASGDEARMRRSQRGFTLIEVLISATVLVVAILGFVASAFASHGLSRTAEDRRIAVETLDRFVERVRADPDWAGLYNRLRPLSSESAKDKNLTWLGTDLSLQTWPANSYYADFIPPTTLGTVTFLVQVPVKTAGGVPSLREDENAPRYGLPRDLNGDALIDDDARAADNRVLPVVARIRWQHPGNSAHEVVLATVLRGPRS